MNQPVVIDDQQVEVPVETPRDAVPAEVKVALVEEDLLVEDVSIDGMCGVY